MKKNLLNELMEMGLSFDTGPGGGFEDDMDQGPANRYDNDDMGDLDMGDEDLEGEDEDLEGEDEDLDTEDLEDESVDGKKFVDTDEAEDHAKEFIDRANEVLHYNKKEAGKDDVHKLALRFAKDYYQAICDALNSVRYAKDSGEDETR